MWVVLNGEVLVERPHTSDIESNKWLQKANIGPNHKPFKIEIQPITL